MAYFGRKCRWCYGFCSQHIIWWCFIIILSFMKICLNQVSWKYPWRYILDYQSKDTKIDPVLLRSCEWDLNRGCVSVWPRCWWNFKSRSFTHVLFGNSEDIERTRFSYKLSKGRNSVVSYPFSDYALYLYQLKYPCKFWSCGVDTILYWQFQRDIISRRL